MLLQSMPPATAGCLKKSTIKQQQQKQNTCRHVLGKGLVAGVFCMWEVGTGRWSAREESGKVGGRK